jgi:hypothetical protein
MKLSNRNKFFIHQRITENHSIQRAILIYTATRTSRIHLEHPVCNHNSCATFPSTERHLKQNGLTHTNPSCPQLRNVPPGVTILSTSSSCFTVLPAQVFFRGVTRAVRGELVHAASRCPRVLARCEFGDEPSSEVDGISSLDPLGSFRCG